MELVVELLGGEIETFGTWTRIHCPLHDDEVSSAGISPDGMTFVCLACNASGDVITLVQQARNLSFVEALEWLEENVIRRWNTTDS
jgi:DNA primase